MIKNISAFIFAVSILLLSQSVLVNSNMHAFDEISVEKNITYMSSDGFKGRLAGTLENLQMSYYIKSNMKSIGLKPLQKDYLEAFKVKYPVITAGTPCLNIVDSSGNIIKEFKYGTDYKEDMLNFRKNSFAFNYLDNAKGNDSILRIDKDGESLIFYVGDNNLLSFRSSFMADAAAGSMYIILTKETFAELKSYFLKGCTINCFIPYTVKETEIYNVTGYLEGKNTSEPPIILSAHYDHLGTDLAGSVYPGALDDASGTAFIIEMARYIKSLGTPDRKIIFAAFNAEEFGCLGSKAFVNDYLAKIKGGTVYNFDMIGSSAVPLCIMGGEKDDKQTSLVKDVSKTCTNEGVPFNLLFQDSSDHMYFRKNNIDAVTFCDNDLTRIHTPLDKASYINAIGIDRSFEVISREIINKAYGGNLILLYYNEMIFICAASSIFFACTQIKLTIKE